MIAVQGILCPTDLTTESDEAMSGAGRATTSGELTKGEEDECSTITTFKIRIQ